MRQKKQAKWDPSRVFQAPGRIGYSPESAILDIVDNSVSNSATRVDIFVNVKKTAGAGKKARAIIDSFEIIDNGTGMDEKGLDNAIALGSCGNYSGQNPGPAPQIN